MATSPDTNSGVSSQLDSGDSTQLVITCKGNINDHDLTQKLHKIRLHLSELSESDDESVSISKIEPWNSIRVTFNIPPEAAQRLQQLAQTDNQVLQNLGILSVQIENNDLVTIPPAQSPASIGQHVQPPIPVGHSVMSSIAPTSSPIRMTVAHQQSNLMNPLHFGGMRPNLPWGQVQMQRIQGNMPAGMQGNVGLPQGSIPSGLQPGIQTGIQLNMQQGMQQNMQGVQSGMHANMQTESQGNIQPGMTTPNMQGTMQGGMQPGRQPGMQGNMPPGMQQGMHANMQPGLQGNIQGAMQPGMQGAMQPGMQGAMQPGIQGGMQPGIQGGIQPGMQGGMQPGMQGGMQPGMQGGMQPGMQGGMQPGMSPGMQGGMPPGIQGNMQSGIQGGMQPNIQQAMQQGMNPNVPPFNQMSQFFYQGEMPMQRFGHNMSPPADARPKKKRRSRPKAKKKNADKEKDGTMSPDTLTKEAENSQSSSDTKAFSTPPLINQMSPTGNSNQSATNQNLQVPTSLPFAEPALPGSAISNIKKPDVSITSPLLVNLLQREIPGTQFPFSNRGIVPSSLANAIQQGALNAKKPMNSQSTLSQGLPPMPPASEITRMLPESIGLPPLPTSQAVSAMSTQMSSPHTLVSTAVRSQTPNRQLINMNQLLSTQQQFQQPSDTTQMNQPPGDTTHNLFGAHQNPAGIANVSAQQNMPTLSNSMARFTTTAGMSLQQSNSVLQPGLGVPFGQMEQSRRTPTPLGNNMSPPVRLSGMQSPGPNNVPFAAPGMINPNMVHGLPTSLQQTLSSAGSTAVYQQGMNEMMHQGQRQFPTVTTQIRNQIPFPLQVQQQQSQINQLNQYFPSNINQQVNPGQTPTNQRIDFQQGANFNPGPMFHQRSQVPGNMPFNMVNIPTSNIAQFRMPMTTELPHNKGMISGNSGNVMQTGPASLIPGTNTRLPIRQRGNQQMAQSHSTHLPPTNITFPSIPRFPVKPQNKMVMPFDETTLDGISDAEKDLLAMAEKVANEAGMETSNRMANLFSKDSSRDNKQNIEALPDDLLKGKLPCQFPDSVRISAGEAIKDAKQKKPPVIQLTKQPHNMYMAGDTQNIASWLPIHGKEGYSLHGHTSSISSDKKSGVKVDNRSKSQGFPEGSPLGNSLNSQPMKSTFCLPGDIPSKSSISHNTVQGVPSLETGAQYVSMPRAEVAYQNINFLSQFNPSAVPDKKLDNPPLSVNEMNRNTHQNIFGTNINAPPQNFNQAPLLQTKVSDKSSILMQMMHMDSTRDNSDMINLTRSISEPLGSHVVLTQVTSDIGTSDSKMPTLERMPRDAENSSTQDQQENGTDVAELNAEYVAKPTVLASTQPLMPQLMPKQPSQQQSLYSPKSLLLPSCMPPPTHGSTGNLASSESQRPATSGQIDKRSRSVSPVTQQGGEFQRLPLSGGSFIKQTPSPTTSSPSGIGMSASALLSSIAKSAYNAGITPRMQSPSETKPTTSQPIGLPSNTSAPSPTGLPLYANPLGPEAHAKPITVRVSPVTAPEVVKSRPLLPSVLPNVSQASMISNEPSQMTEQSNSSSPIKTTVEIQEAPVTLPQPTHLEEPPELPVPPPELPVPHKENILEQTPSSNPPLINVPIQQPIINETKEESIPTVEHSTPTVEHSAHEMDIGPNHGASVRDQPLVEEVASKSELPIDFSATVPLKRKHDGDVQIDPAPKILKVDSELPKTTNQVIIEEDHKKCPNIEQTDSDGDLSGEHRPLPLLVRESTIEIGQVSTEKDHGTVDLSFDATIDGNPVVMSKEVLTMPTLLPSKVELTDIAKCKDTHQFSFKLEDKTQTGEGSSTSESTKMSAPPKDLHQQNIDMKATTTKEVTEAKQESTQVAPKIETPVATTTKGSAEVSPVSSKDSTKSSPVERRTTPKRKAAEEASRPTSERTTSSRQCTLQVDEPPATRARRATRNKSPADHPTRLREKEDSTSTGSTQHTDQGTDNDARMTRKRSTRIIGKGSKDNKDK